MRTVKHLTTTKTLPTDMPAFLADGGKVFKSGEMGLDGKSVVCETADGKVAQIFVVSQIPTSLKEAGEALGEEEVLKLVEGAIKTRDKNRGRRGSDKAAGGKAARISELEATLLSMLKTMSDKDRAKFFAAEPKAEKLFNDHK